MSSYFCRIFLVFQARMTLLKYRYTCQFAIETPALSDYVLEDVNLVTLKPWRERRGLE